MTFLAASVLQYVFNWRKVSFGLILLMGGVLWALCPVAAQAKETIPALKIGHVTAASGHLISVPIHLTSSGRVAGMQFDLGYNDELLTFVSVIEGNLTKSFLRPESSRNGEIRVVIFSQNRELIQPGSDSIAHINFELISGLDDGLMHQFNAKNVKIVDSYPRLLPSEHYDGSWQVINKPVAKDKIWNISFSQPVAAEYKDLIVVTKLDGRRQDIGAISLADKQTVQVKPPASGYPRGVYRLIVPTKLCSQEGQHLKNPVVWQFVVD